MRIKKIGETTPRFSETVNTFSNSTKDSYACDYVNKAIENAVQDVYSTNEIKTNKVWIDEKPIYRKVVSVNFPTSSSTATTNHNISNIDTVTDYELIWFDTTDSKWYKSYKDTTGQYYVQADGISSTSVYVKSGSNYDWTRRTSNRYAIIEYTKTTD